MSAEKNITRSQNSRSLLGVFPFSTIFGPNGFISQLSRNFNGENEDGDDTVEKVQRTISTKSSQVNHCKRKQNMMPESKNINKREKLATSHIEETEPRFGHSRLEILPLRPHCLDQEREKSSRGKYLQLGPNEQLINIDLIAKQILGHMNTPDLHNLRHVNHRLEGLATQTLRKRLQFVFSACELLHHPLKNSNLQKFIEYLPTSYNFPCTNYTFTHPPSLCHKYNEKCGLTSNLNNDVYQNFFTIFGIHIQKLKLNIEHWDRRHWPFENEVMESIGNILEETPNLQFLSIHIQCFASWQIENLNGISRDNYSHLYPSDPEFIKIHSQNISPNQMNTKLTVLEVTQYCTSKIQEFIIHRAPNLTEINLRKNGAGNYSNTNRLNYLLQPKDRTHLLKKLELSSSIQDFELFRKIAFSIKIQKTVLRELRIFLEYQNMLEILRYSDDTNNYVCLINDILEYSCKSLQIIDWNGIVGFCGIKWPLEMLNLRKLQFGRLFEFPQHNLLNSHSQPFLVTSKFPKLTTVRIYEFYEVEDMIKLTKCLSSETLLQVGTFSVKYCSNELVQGEYLEAIQKLFPNARQA